MQPRSEQEIFHDLESLCKSPGFIHAVSMICMRDNAIGYNETLTPNDLSNTYRAERLIRTEITTLIGLMLKDSIDYTPPTEAVLVVYMESVDKLLLEFHSLLSQQTMSVFNPIDVANGVHPLKTSSGLREAIFYTGESAYNFQYKEFAKLKYNNDSIWLSTKKGFTIADGALVIDDIIKLMESKSKAYFDRAQKLGGFPSPLPIFKFTLTELTNNSILPESTIRAFLNSMQISPRQGANSAFNRFGDYNEASAFPLIKCAEDCWIGFQYYGLVESLYESPFYWMIEDSSYKETAGKNRGAFLEEFAYNSLIKVFGTERVYKNVKIYEGNDVAGEIDVLVKYADRLLIIQCKTKKMTLKSRSGDIGQINKDFQSSMQDAYNQCKECAELIFDGNKVIKDENNVILTLPTNISEIIPICLTSEHYPALSLQVSNYLKFTASEKFLKPFVLDIFALDTIVEFLNTPIHFLSYVIRRVSYFDKILANHELTVLSLHLRQNLWLEDDLDMAYLTDDISADLDTAMMVRRQGFPGSSYPDGILTKKKGKYIGAILDSLSQTEAEGALELSIILLKYSEIASKNIDLSIGAMIENAKQNGHSDISICNKGTEPGFTIHCNAFDQGEACRKLINHCHLRKYRQKAEKWVGICIHPINQSIRYGLLLSKPWSFDSDLDQQSKELPKAITTPDMLKRLKVVKKIGRNDPCPCGGVKKFKKCCLGKIEP